MTMIQRLALTLLFTVAVYLVQQPPVQAAPLSQSPTSDPQAGEQITAPVCDAQVYYGIQHCYDALANVHLLIVNLQDPHVRFETVLPINPATNQECNSVNPITRDLTSNCPFPYPLETVDAMLQRYLLAGAVAVIGTDRFDCAAAPPNECGGASANRGALGFAVKNGVRLDGPAHGVTNNIAYTAPSLAIAQGRQVTIGIPGSATTVADNLVGRYYNTVAGSPLLIANRTKIPLPCSQLHHPHGQTCEDDTHMGVVITAQSAAALSSDGQMLVLATAQKRAEPLADYLLANTGNLIGGRPFETALKFDGGLTASMAWLGSDGRIESYSPVGQTYPVAAGLAIFSEYTSAPPPGVFPPYRAPRGLPGVSLSLAYTLSTGSTPIDKGDVMFVFDRTGSMGEEISQTTTSAQQIMQNVVTQLPNTWFGVAGFMDYPGFYTYPGYANDYGIVTDLPWQLNLQPTSNIPTVVSTLGGLTLGEGQDFPESYTRMLSELRRVQWRANSKKIAVVYGDAPAHDLNFAGANFGGDPGVDALANTPDDLDFETVMQQVREAGITVIAVNSAVPGEDQYNGAVATMKGMSIGYDSVPGTTGQYFELTNTAQLPAVTTQLILSETVLIDNLTFKVTDGFESWVQIDPPSFQKVSGNAAKAFSVILTPPAQAQSGLYPIVIQAIGDGSVVGVSYINLTLPAAQVITDTAFRPNPHGYALPNTPNTPTWQMFRQFFGAGQVEYANGDRIHAANAFFQQYYQPAGSQGRSDGLAITSIVNHKRLSQPNAGPFAMPRVGDLFTTVNAAAVDMDITNAIGFAQGLQTGLEASYFKATLCQSTHNSPDTMYRYAKGQISHGGLVMINLIDPQAALPAAHYTVFPYRFRELIDGRFYLDVYDPAHPGDNARTIEFSRQAGKFTWKYAINAQGQPEQLIGGNEDSCTLTVTPLGLYSHTGVAWWKAAPNWPPTSMAAVLAPDVAPNITPDVVYSADQLRTFGTPPAVQLFAVSGAAELLLIDDDGHRLGFELGNFYAQIDGAAYQSVGEGATRASLYYVPIRTGYTAQLVGKASGKATLSVYGENHYAQLTLNTLALGAGAILTVTADGSRISIKAEKQNLQGTLSLNRLLTLADRTVQFGNLQWQPGDTISLFYVPAATSGPDAIELSHSGNSNQRATLSLQQASETGHTIFGVGEVSINANSTAGVEVDDWQRINSATLAVTESNGAVTRQTYPNQSAVNRISFEAFRTTLPPTNQAMTVTVLVYDQFGLLVADGTPVQLSTTLGTLSSTSFTTTGGLGHVLFNSGQQAGTATITAQSAGVTGIVRIVVAADRQRVFLPFVHR